MQSIEPESGTTMSAPSHLPCVDQVDTQFLETLLGGLMAGMLYSLVALGFGLGLGVAYQIVRR